MEKDRRLGGERRNFPAFLESPVTGAFKVLLIGYDAFRLCLTSVWGAGSSTIIREHLCDTTRAWGLEKDKGTQTKG